MLKIGCHLSSAGGFAKMGENALTIGANVFQFFTRNPRGSKAKAIDPEDARVLRGMLEDGCIQAILVHAPYTLNACSAEPQTREFAEMVMTDDLVRMENFPGSLYNFHPGSHVGQGAQKGIEKIAELLNRILRPEQTTTILLETMAGKGSEVGRSFEELRQIIDCVELNDKIGVCLDTCHVHDAGYDLIGGLDAMLESFDRTIGIARLKAVHLNDSLNSCGSHKDRHAKIGEGCIGQETIVRVVNHALLRDLPFFLETPNELDGYAAEIALLKANYLKTE